MTKKRSYSKEELKTKARVKLLGKGFANRLGQSGWTVAAYDDYRGVLLPKLYRLEDEIDADWSGDKMFEKDQVRGLTAIQMISIRYATRFDKEADSVNRRLYRLIHNPGGQEDRVAIDYGDADEILLCTDNSLIENHSSIPCLAGRQIAANEMVESYEDAKGIKMDDDEKKKLAKSLYHFSQGYIWELKYGKEEN
jgi:hypothetical protein